MAPGSNLITFLFDVSADADLTAAVDLTGVYVQDIIMPAAWTAASIVFQVCETVDGTYQPFQKWDESDPMEILVEAGVRSGDLVSYLIGDCFVKLQSVVVGTPGTGQDQAADRTVIVKVRKLG